MCAKKAQVKRKKKAGHSQKNVLEVESLFPGFPGTPVIYFNVHQEYVFVDTNTLRLALGRHVKKLNKRCLWVAPLGILTTILLGLCTKDFDDFMLPAETWRCVFGSVFLVCLLWFIYAIVQSFRHTRSEHVIDELICELEGNDSNECKKTYMTKRNGRSSTDMLKGVKAIQEAGQGK